MNNPQQCGRSSAPSKHKSLSSSASTKKNANESARRNPMHNKKDTGRWYQRLPSKTALSIFWNDRWSPMITPLCQRQTNAKGLGLEYPKSYIQKWQPVRDLHHLFRPHQLFQQNLCLTSLPLYSHSGSQWPAVPPIAQNSGDSGFKELPQKHQLAEHGCC